MHATLITAKVRRKAAPHLFAFFIISLAVGTHACADEILIGDEAVHHAKVTGFSKGMLSYEDSRQKETQVDLLHVNLIVIDSILGMADFNEAEEYSAKEQFVQAVNRYERALRSSSGFWSDLARARLLAAADMAKQSEKVGRLFLEIVKTDPVTAARLFPRTIPRHVNNTTQRISENVEQLLERSEDERILALATIFRLETVSNVNPDEYFKLAKQVAALNIPQDILCERIANALLETLANLLSSGDHEATVSCVNRLIENMPDKLLPKAIMLKARGLLAGARSENDYMDATLAAMRVAIHYENDPLAGDALMLAAEAQTAAGKSETAARILRECLRREATSEATKQQARQDLTKLTKSQMLPSGSKPDSD